MPENPEYLSAALRSILWPLLSDTGFRRHGERLFLRLREPFVDAIGVQLSLYGSGDFFVHFSVRMLANPLLDVDAWRVGKRLSDNRDGGDDRDWNASDARRAELAVSSVRSACEERLLEWLDSIVTPADYVFELASDAQRFAENLSGLEAAVAFAEAGRRQRAWWICNEILRQFEAVPAESEEDRLTEQFCRQFIEADEREQQALAFQSPEAFAPELLEALAASDGSTAEAADPEALLQGWRQRNIDRLGLSA